MYIFKDELADIVEMPNVKIIPVTKGLGRITGPIIFSIPLQLLSYHVAELKGCNVDQPRNLAKSVTVEWFRNNNTKKSIMVSKKLGYRRIILRLGNTFFLIRTFTIGVFCSTSFFLQKTPQIIMYLLDLYRGKARNWIS